MFSKKKVVSVLSSLAVGFGTLSMAAFNSAPTEQLSDYAYSSNIQGGAPFDLAIANEEKLIEMLQKNGTISEGASLEEAQEALKGYFAGKQSSSSKEHGDLHDKEKERQALLNSMKSNNSLTSGKGNKLGQAKKNKLDSVKEEAWDGGTREDRVLVLLVEFPDFPHNSIQPGESDMYYADYVKEHYQDMVFGANGYEGPNGENLISMKQYYEQQSGGSYSVTGEVAGWYMASQPAAYYGGNYPTPDGSDANPRSLVYEALLSAAADPSVDLSYYDQEDRYDLDGDGDYREPDGLIDHLMVVHSAMGEEAGGGSLGGDAIWSHRWNLGGVAPIWGQENTTVDYWGAGVFYAYDYTIEPADGAAGVFAHEYGHDLGLPDEYDTQYTGKGEPVSYWSIMSSGSWAGMIPGTEPTGFSAWSKEFLQGSMPDSNWLSGTDIHINDLDRNGIEVILDEAVTKGTNNDVVKINLPEKVNVINSPASGEWEFYSGNGDQIDHSMLTTLDLTGSSSATLEYDVWYNIESNWDYGMIQVSTDSGATWQSLSTSNTSSDIDPRGYPSIFENLPGYTGSSNGWIHESIDLSAYTGQEIMIQFRYMTDWGTNLDGMYVDNISVSADGQEILFDGAENETSFTLHDFSVNPGYYTSHHYYLLEWRSHNGVDQGLAHIPRGSTVMQFDPGLVIWYVDDNYDNNWVGLHPGDGFLGVVDADQSPAIWSDNGVASTRYQVHDAAFSLQKSEKLFIDYSELYGITLRDHKTTRNVMFDDSASYLNPVAADAGRNVPQYGLKVRVIGESSDRSTAKILIFR